MTDPNMDMDAILDEALDELDDDDDDSELDTGNAAAAADNNPLTPQHAADQQGLDAVSEDDVEDTAKSPADVFQNMLKDFIEADDDGTDPKQRLGQFMDEVQAQLPPEEDEDSDLPDEEDTNPKEGIEQTIASILEEMSKANLGDVPDIDAKDFDFDPEHLNPDALIDGMMQQLLSKDLMYEPMKQVAEKFPAWLDENKATLPADDYEKRANQYECFRKLVHVYETQPDNVAELLELMQQVQEYGQPPQDIISDIAPGLELDDDGMPKMNPMEGIPGLGGENEECRIM